MTQENLLQAIDIKQHILWIRNKKVMLDSGFSSFPRIAWNEGIILPNTENKSAKC